MTETERAWWGRVREWRSSGLSAPEYARGRGFASSTLRWWASRLSRAPGTGQPSVRMARVVRVVRPIASTLTVRVGAVQVEVSSGFDGALLRELVDALVAGPR